MHPLMPGPAVMVGLGFLFGVGMTREQKIAALVTAAAEAACIVNTGPAWLRSILKHGFVGFACRSDEELDRAMREANLTFTDVPKNGG